MLFTYLKNDLPNSFIFIKQLNENQSYLQQKQKQFS